MRAVVKKAYGVELKAEQLDVEGELKGMALAVWEIYNQMNIPDFTMFKLRLEEFEGVTEQQLRTLFRMHLRKGANIYLYGEQGEPIGVLCSTLIYLVDVPTEESPVAGFAAAGILKHGEEAMKAAELEEKLEAL